MSLAIVFKSAAVSSLTIRLSVSQSVNQWLQRYNFRQRRAAEQRTGQFFDLSVRVSAHYLALIFVARSENNAGIDANYGAD
jgi:hypothetical protein